MPDLEGIAANSSLMRRRGFDRLIPYPNQPETPMEKPKKLRLNKDSLKVLSSGEKAAVEGGGPNMQTSVAIPIGCVSAACASK